MHKVQTASRLIRYYVHFHFHRPHHHYSTSRVCMYVHCQRKDGAFTAPQNASSEAVGLSSLRVQDRKDDKEASAQLRRS